MIAFKTNRSKDISFLLETYLKMHATQNQKPCSGEKVRAAVTAPSDPNLKTYAPPVILLKKDRFHIEQLTVTASLDQDEPTYADIPSSEDPVHKELVLTPSVLEVSNYTEESDQEEGIYTELNQEDNETDQNETTYSERCSSAISSSEDPLSNELIVTPSHQGKIYLIPSKGESAIKELILTPSHQYETMYSPPGSPVVPLVDDHTSHSDQTILTTQSSHAGNGDIVSCNDSAIALVNRRHKSQTKSINGSSCISSSDQTTLITPSDYAAYDSIRYNDSSVIASSGRCNPTCGQTGSTTCAIDDDDDDDDDDDYVLMDY